MTDENEEGKFLTWKDDQKKWKKLIELELNELREIENTKIKNSTIKCLKLRKLLDKCWEEEGKNNCEKLFSDFSICTLKLYHDIPTVLFDIGKPFFIFPIEKILMNKIFEIRKENEKIKNKKQRNECRNEIDKFVNCLENSKDSEEAFKKCEKKKLEFCLENVFERVFE